MVSAHPCPCNLSVLGWLPTAGVHISVPKCHPLSHGRPSCLLQGPEVWDSHPPGCSKSSPLELQGVWVILCCVPFQEVFFKGLPPVTHDRSGPKHVIFLSCSPFPHCPTPPPVSPAYLKWTVCAQVLVLWSPSGRTQTNIYIVYKKSNKHWNFKSVSKGFWVGSVIILYFFLTVCFKIFKLYRKNINKTWSKRYWLK